MVLYYVFHLINFFLFVYKFGKFLSATLKITNISFYSLPSSFMTESYCLPQAGYKHFFFSDYVTLVVVLKGCTTVLVLYFFPYSCPFY